MFEYSRSGLFIEEEFEGCEFNSSYGDRSLPLMLRTPAFKELTLGKLELFALTSSITEPRPVAVSELIARLTLGLASRSINEKKNEGIKYIHVHAGEAAEAKLVMRHRFIALRVCWLSEFRLKPDHFLNDLREGRPETAATKPMLIRSMPSRYQLSTVPPPGLGADVRLGPVRTCAVPCAESGAQDNSKLIPVNTTNSDKEVLQKADNGQTTPLSLRLSVGGGDRPPSDGPQARHPFLAPLKRIVRVMRIAIKNQDERNAKKIVCASEGWQALHSVALNCNHASFPAKCVVRTDGLNGACAIETKWRTFLLSLVVRVLEPFTLAPCGRCDYRHRCDGYVHDRHLNLFCEARNG
ncbi:hypothetical protein EVAR_94658_1 [Eumeta japonica]|uniref:Uncharacterized protein n=1 Tax=Eumeta variegata TaxID=151549 RepID=A0A4C1UTQ3_EUMVA|nr:hypothetical protein EVAR_94658_1 [Eumeta japonica]